MANVFATGTALEFDPTDYRHGYRALKLDSTHWLFVWSGPGNDGFARVFAANETTGAITGLGTALEFDTTDMSFNGLCLLDATHAAVVWQRSATASLVVALTWDANWTVTVASQGGVATYITDDHRYQQVLRVDPTHAMVLVSDQTNSADGIAAVFAFDANWDPTTIVGSIFEFDTTGATWIGAARVGKQSDQKFFVAHRQSATAAIAKVLDVAGDYTITAASPADVTFETTNPSHCFVVTLDTYRVLVTWVAGATCKAQVFSVNPSTWAVTAVGTACTLGTTYITGSGGNGFYSTSLWKEDDLAWYVAHAGEIPSDAGALISILRVDKSTGTVTEMNGAALVTISTTVPYPVFFEGPSERLMVAYGSTSGDGFMNALAIKDQRDLNTLLWTFHNKSVPYSTFVDMNKLLQNALAARTGDYANRLITEIAAAEDFNLTQQM